ncbi:MAG: hypothetical protein BRC33_06790 [Cyanobacteria bacterium SW_9_44_58]|nr:MAG: hypothetical protein BRC33_06790 [Cyanobacteria bacterium SW_9_44_58]
MSLLGALGIALLIFPFPAEAQSIKLKSGKALGNACQFKDVETGSLTVRDNGKVLEGSTVQISLECNTKGVQLRAEQPVQESPSSFSLEDSPYNAYVGAIVEYISDGPGNSPNVSETIEVNNAGNPSETTQERGNGRPTAGENKITIKMRVESEEILPAGEYTFTINLTAVP